MRNNNIVKNKADYLSSRSSKLAMLNAMRLGIDNHIHDL